MNSQGENAVRKVITMTALLLLVASQAIAAPPFIIPRAGSNATPRAGSPSGPSATANRLGAPAQARTSVQGKSGWSLSKFLFGSQPESGVPSPPPHSFVGQQPQQSTWQRVAQSVDPRSYMSSQPSAPTNNDVLSLNTPGTAGADIFLALARQAEQQGNIPAAREQLQKALVVDPTSVSVLRDYGHLEDRAGRLVEAEKLYLQAASVAPTNSAVLNDLALCYARQGRLHESVATLDKAIALKPTKPLYRNNIAKVLVELRQNDRAIDHLQQGNAPAVAYYNFGKLLADKGQTAEAEAAWRQALAVQPGFRPAIAALGPAATPVAAPQMAAAQESTFTPGQSNGPSGIQSGIQISGPMNFPMIAPPVAGHAVANEITPIPASPNDPLPALAGPELPKLLPPALD